MWYVEGMRVKDTSTWIGTVQHEDRKITPLLYHMEMNRRACQQNSEPSRWERWAVFPIEKGRTKPPFFLFSFFLNASCNIYCNNNLPPEGGHVTGICWSAFHSCKQCVLDKIQQTQPVVIDQIWLHITPHVMLYRFVHLFYWNSNRVRCSFITVLYFNNSSGHFKLKRLLLLCTIYL